MPRAQAGYTVRRIAGDLADLLDEQGDKLARAIALVDDDALLRLLIEMVRDNADLMRVVTLLQAGQVTEAEAAVLQLRTRRLLHGRAFE